MFRWSRKPSISYRDFEFKDTVARDAFLLTDEPLRIELHPYVILNVFRNREVRLMGVKVVQKREERALSSLAEPTQEFVRNLAPRFSARLIADGDSLV